MKPWLSDHVKDIFCRVNKPIWRLWKITKQIVPKLHTVLNALPQSNGFLFSFKERKKKKKTSLEIALMRRTGITHRPFYPLRKANDSLFLYALFL